MCGITGWVSWNKDLTRYPAILENMTETLAPRGPDASGKWLTANCAFGHRRLSVIDPAGGAQPMVRRREDDTYVIVYNGELYNAPELRRELESSGYSFRTTCDTEVLLLSYMEWGESCVDRLNGIFAFAVWDDNRRRVFLARDRLGVKPLFYALRDGELLFGSEPKAILAHPGFPAEVDAEGLAEVFALGPARTPGHGIYRGLKELLPGHCLTFTPEGASTRAYWRLEALPHRDDEEDTAEHIRWLLRDTLERQLVSDVPVCALLSGGLDSSALSALAADYYARTGQGTIDTYSIDYVGNDKHFRASVYQPNPDRPWVDRMREHLNTRHHFVEFDTPELVDSLRSVVLARDTPGMADVDGSLLLFCREIKKNATVAISGEAADEVFGGYPWFHRKEALEANTFPWAISTEARFGLLSPELAKAIRPEEYVADRYRQAIGEVPHLDGEDPAARRMREMSYLNITRFMPTLLDRKDRMSMACGLEVRVPYCDHRLVQYVWNVPWSIKSKNGREKGILRHALRGVLPDDVIDRKKSPFPKTHNPAYAQAVKRWVLDILDDSRSPLRPLVNAGQLRKLAADDLDSFQIPFFGQLMTGPQTFAFLAQVDTWLREYKVRLVL
ncbi:asparagine synthase (glutamine-hydrolyzing) [Paenibacillus thermoaerophilus]|uniref:asparagine synthase (glutamine-hydrolyzing) n=1 Tax=Paenibacillus thermoaerophilus TaxID=1215385 RepID=A0ABW2V729_9BACL|nr:asparagine synthase (glutamine-hydrolyzing) [Paenibacillus thermoaerophilus]TMV11067.1 asparagine synthase (glutamine-hydrolyzing) [Paenibacillus thermoaerophilus]